VNIDRPAGPVAFPILLQSEMLLVTLLHQQPEVLVEKVMILALGRSIPGDYGIELFEKKSISAFGLEVEEDGPCLDDVVFVDVDHVELIVVGE